MALGRLWCVNIGSSIAIDVPVWWGCWQEEARRGPNNKECKM